MVHLGISRLAVKQGATLSSRAGRSREEQGRPVGSSGWGWVDLRAQVHSQWEAQRSATNTGREDELCERQEHMGAISAHHLEKKKLKRREHTLFLDSSKEADGTLFRS